MRVKMKMVICFLAGAVLLISLTVSDGFAVTLFSEDFESYAAGTNLDGQGGWATTSDCSDPFIVDIGFNRTHVADGYRDEGGYFSRLEHSFAGGLSSSGISTLTVDAYAHSSSPPTHNSQVELWTNTNILIASWLAHWTYGNVWYFKGETFGGLFNQAVELGIVIDGGLNEYYGTIRAGEIFYETTHYSITDSEIESIDRVALLTDYRQSYYSGAEFDNILMETEPIPEPATMLLLGSGLIGLAGARRKSKNRHTGQTG